jgi:hypothetical protein
MKCVTYHWWHRHGGPVHCQDCGLVKRHEARAKGEAVAP